MNVRGTPQFWLRVQEQKGCTTQTLQPNILRKIRNVKTFEEKIQVHILYVKGVGFLGGFAY